MDPDTSHIYDPTAMPANKAVGMPRRAPTRRLDERKIMVLAADRLEELSAALAPEVYDHGTMNLVRDLRMLGGQR